MNFNRKNRVKRYLIKFNEILCAMENRMICTNENGDITKYFIECMIPHHQAAIYMCENLLQYTDYMPLIRIANNIISMQTEGIKKMKNIYNTTKEYENSEQNMKCYQEKYCDIVSIMVYEMKNSPKTMNINYNFVNEMIPHHEGAIHMCKNLLKYNIDSRLKEVANSIIKEQENGVREMKALLNN